MKKQLGLLCLFAAALAPFARATIVTITINGTVDSGSYDYYGNVFTNSGTYTYLTNDAFTLTLTFDDSMGTGTLGSTCSGAYFQTYIENSGSSNPGTATLTINGYTFHFDTSHGGNAMTSIAMRYADSSFTTCSSGYPSGALNYWVGVTGYTSGSASVGWYSTSTEGVGAASGDTFGGNPSWEKSLSQTNTDSTHYLPFAINCTSGGVTYYSGGYLQPSNVTISGT
jgi:hypothetical protein